METLNPLTKERSTSQKVAETLKDAIFRGELPLGERLVEANIAKSLHVSITPVRHAFTQLANEGLINVVPYKETHVVQINETFVNEVFSVRTPLELMAVELACPRLTPADCDSLENLARAMDTAAHSGKNEEMAKYDIQFHGLFYERSQHTLLLHIWKTIQARIQLLQSYGRTHHQPAPAGEVEQRHMKIIKAVRLGDSELLKKRVKEHIDTGKRMVLKRL
jgi:DNA-binding GntR family transcriptional regulator